MEGRLEQDLEGPIEVAFPAGRTAAAVRLRSRAALLDGVAALGLPRGRPTVVLIGGAAGLADDDAARLRSLFADGLVPLLQELDAVAVDGGTDSGVMRLLGQARAARRATFPLVGVAAVGTVAPPVGSGARADAAALEPAHTHFVLVPGEQWGDEVPWLARVAGVLATGARSATTLANGGEISWRDVAESIAADRPVVVIAGSGRTADRLAAALRDGTADDRARPLVASGLLSAVDLADGATALSAALRVLLVPAG